MMVSICHWDGSQCPERPVGTVVSALLNWLNSTSWRCGCISSKPHCNHCFDSHLEITPHYYMSILRCSFHQEVSMKAIPVEWIIISPPHQTCLSYRIMMSSILTFLSSIFKKKKKKKNPQRNDPASVSKSFPLHFQICLFLGQHFSLRLSLSWFGFFFFFLNFLFPIELCINSFCLKPFRSELFPFLLASTFSATSYSLDTRRSHLFQMFWQSSIICT